VLNPLRTFAAVVPFFARIVDFGTGVVAIALTLVIGLSTIALAWMVARPLLSVALLAGTLALVFGLLRRRGASTNAPTVAAVPPPPPPPAAATLTSTHRLARLPQSPFSVGRARRPGCLCRDARCGGHSPPPWDRG